MHAEIMKPLVVLAGWSMVMWIWLYVTRIPAMRKAGIDARKSVGGTGRTLDDALEPKAQWVAHNYNHLMEQPTVFYAVALALAFMGWGNGLNAIIAWGYVGLRILHSLVQVTTNRVIIRFSLFALSSLCLIALIVHAAMAAFGAH